MRKLSSLLLATHTLLLISFGIFTALAQPVELAPFIGLDAEPSNSDAICETPIYPDISEELEGLAEGDFIYDFKLFTLTGDSVVASELLADGKPALFIGASYTCFVFRSKIPVINMLQEIYGELINIFIVYTVEAHPNEDISPYFGVEAVGDINIEQGILYNQPTTYGERKAIVADMLMDEDINVPVLIDGPCNEWWLNFGTNPNHAYLVQPDGVIYDAQKWFDRYPDDIVVSIDALLSGEEPEPTEDAEGYFNAFVNSEECAAGIAGETIVSHVSVQNLDIIDSYLDIFKMDSDLPADWLTSLCTDVCYPPDVENTNFLVEASSTSEFSVYFYTTLYTDAEGTLTLLVKNHFNNDNWYILDVKACAEAGEVTATYELSSISELRVFPSPADSYIQFVLPKTASDVSLVKIKDIAGRTVLSQTKQLNANEIILLPVEELQSGMYLLEISTETGSRIFSTPFMKQ